MLNYKIHCYVIVLATFSTQKHNSRLSINTSQPRMWRNSNRSDA